jgi:uncharacterized RDD family membrane protein YckC
MSHPVPVPASLPRRLAAGFYDGLLLVAIWLIGTLPWVLIRGGEVPAGHPLFLAWLLGLTALFFAWFWRRNAQTLGMQAWRIRLEGVDGGPAPLPALLFRVAVILLFILLMVYATAFLARPEWNDRLGWLMLSPMLASLLWMLVDRDGLALHDRLTGTRLVHVPKATEKEKR